MKSHIDSALALGACIIIGCGVIAIAFGSDTGQVVAFIAIAFGGWLLKQAMELSNKK